MPTTSTTSRPRPSPSRVRRRVCWSHPSPCSPPPIRTRVLRQAALEAGALAAELFHAHVLDIDRLVTDWHGQKWVDLPGHLRAVRRGGLLTFEPQTG